MNAKQPLFISKLKQTYPLQCDEILQNISTSRYETFRINTLKTTAEEVLSTLDTLGFNIKPGPFSNSYINLSFPDKKVSQTNLPDTGAVYIQGLASMLAAVALSPRAADKILDLCAAPGSKTTHIGALTEGKAEIYAVETNSNRFNLMKKNFALYGLPNILTVKANAVAFPTIRSDLVNYFDKVLVDVPCSNEGNIRQLDSYTFKFWNARLPKRLSQLQKKLLAAGLHMLKPGGELVYSTCTYSVEENEQVVDWALKHFSGISLLPINFSETNCVNGFAQWKDKTFDTTLTKTLRILPNEFFDGFFVAKFRKA